MPHSMEPPVRPEYFHGDMWLRSDGQMHIYYKGYGWRPEGDKIDINAHEHTRRAIYAAHGYINPPGS